MSFSLDVKNELSRIFSEDREAQLAELSALIRTSGTLKIIGLNKLAFSIFTDNIAIARKTFALIKNCFNISIEIQIKKIGTKQSYTLNISYDDGANEILKEVGIIEIEDSYIRLLENLPDKFFKNRENKRAYIRGMFLGSGSITNPLKMYHMEFASTDLRSM